MRTKEKIGIIFIRQWRGGAEAAMLAHTDETEQFEVKERRNLFEAQIEVQKKGGRWRH